jgi:hypothetical protein
MFDDLRDDNILLYAIKSYDGLNYIKSEFKDDYRLFRYVKRLLIRYRTTGEIKINLALNHINMVYNTFGAEAGVRLLFYKMEPVDYSSLKTFLLFLSLMPDVVYGIRGTNIISSDIPVDMTIANQLRLI